MLAAISRDSALVSGGLGSGRRSQPGHAFIEPIAYVSDSGKWESLPCGAGREGTQPKGCEVFAKEYLSKKHTYTVITADGDGAVVHAMPSQLSECSDYSSDGTYSGASISRVAIAASNPSIFSKTDIPKELSGISKSLNRALAALVPQKLDSDKNLKIISLRLEDQNLIVIKREIGDLPETQNVGDRRYIFGIGVMDKGHFHISHWKENSIDEIEGIVGIIRLKIGREFLITSVSDPEGQWFRVYGVKDGNVVLVFSGGGSSC